VILFVVELIHEQPTARSRREADDRGEARIDVGEVCIVYGSCGLSRAPNHCNRRAQATYSRVGFEKLSRRSLGIGWKANRIVRASIMLRLLRGSWFRASRALGVREYTDLHPAPSDGMAATGRDRAVRHRLDDAARMRSCRCVVGVRFMFLSVSVLNTPYEMFARAVMPRAADGCSSSCCD